MAELETTRDRQPFIRRVLWPAGIGLAAWAVLNSLTSHLEWFGSGLIYRTSADLFYSLLGFTIIFSSPVVYSLLYFRGASTLERILWAYSVPLAWILKEIWRVRAIFTWGESFYYALSPLQLGLLVFQLFSLCLCEIFWRWHFQKKNRSVRIFTPGPILGLITFLVLIYFMLFWGNAGDTPGSNLFYRYMEGYKAFFINK
jgi:hypothetical protein